MTLSLTIFIIYVTIVNSVYIFCLVHGKPRKAYRTVVVILASGLLCKYTIVEHSSIFMNVENLPFVLSLILVHGTFSYQVLLKKVMYGS